MKKIVKLSIAILSLSALSRLACAAVPGAYAGLGLGASSLDTPSMPSSEVVGLSTSSSKGGLGGEIFGGYNFNQYFGVEAGIKQYANSTYKVSGFGANA